MVQGNIQYEVTIMKMSNKKRYTFTLKPTCYNKLCSIARKHKRSKSNMIEILIENAWENKCNLSQTIIRNKIDELETQKKKDPWDLKPE